MGLCRRARDALENREHLSGQERAAFAHELPEVATIEELGHLKGALAPRDVAKVVDAKRVRVLQLRQGERLADEVLVDRVRFWVVRQGRNALDLDAKKLHADDPIEALVVGAMDGRHSSVGDAVEDGVAIE